jgi:hypothetical protein
MKDMKYAVRAMENVARIDDLETLRDVRDAVRMRYNVLRAERAQAALARHKRENA